MARRVGSRRVRAQRVTTIRLSSPTDARSVIDQLPDETKEALMVHLLREAIPSDVEEFRKMVEDLPDTDERKRVFEIARKAVEAEIQERKLLEDQQRQLERAKGIREARKNATIRFIKSIPAAERYYVKEDDPAITSDGKLRMDVVKEKTRNYFIMRNVWKALHDAVSNIQALLKSNKQLTKSQQRALKEFLKLVNDLEDFTYRRYHTDKLWREIKVYDPTSDRKAISRARSIRERIVTDLSSPERIRVYARNLPELLTKVFKHHALHKDDVDFHVQFDQRFNKVITKLAKAGL